LIPSEAELISNPPLLKQFPHRPISGAWLSHCDSSSIQESLLESEKGSAEVLNIAWDKVTAITDMLQHQRKVLGLFGLMLDNFESVFLVCKIERVMHGNK